MSAGAKPFRYALATFSTSTGFTAQNATATKPTGDGTVDLLDPKYGFGGSVPDWLQLMPFGTNGDNDTFDMRLYGWNQTIDDTPIYIPQLLVDVSVVLCALTATPIVASGFLADTITVNDGAADNAEWLSVISPAEDLPASIIVHTRGCRWLKWDWDLAGGQEGVLMNCLWRGIDTINRY